MTQYSDNEFIPLSNQESDGESNASDASDNENLYSDEEAESDSEPECVSFSTTLEKNKQNQKITAQVLKVQKDDLKRKRKEVLLKNVKQREEKRQKLASKRLPDHILENLEDDLETTEAEDKNLESQEDTVDETESEVVQTAGNINFKCKVLHETKKAIPEKFVHFKEQMLFGSRIKREKSNRHAVLKREKQCSRK